jgi:hypothetical protein
MTILSLPTLARANTSQCTFGLQPNTQTFESPLNKTVQTYELPGARWLLTATWQNLNQADARIFKAWLAKLRGAAGRFYAYDMAHKTPSGNVTGSGTVYGASQTGTSLVTAWGTSSISNWFLPGDYFSVNNELKIITAVISLDGSGHATLVFEPPLRSSPTDSSAIIIASPTAIFRLNDDKQDVANFDPDRHPTITISATESFS